MTRTNNFLTQTKLLETWLINKALPVWSGIGINPDNCSVFEQLDSNGQPDRNANIRSRVQARQIFVFSSAETMGWMSDSYSKVSGINQFLEQHAKVSEISSGYAHLLGPKGSIIDPKKDAYDFAFFLLSCACQYKTYQDTKSLIQAEELFQHIDSHFKGDLGGWSEGDYPFQHRRQNPHMHLFEAFMSLYEITKDAKWLARAGQVFSLFENVFFDAKLGVLREYFNEDWTLVEGEKGNIIEPGHMFEWVWLLRWYEKLTGANVSKYCDLLYENGMRIGFSQNDGLIFDEVEPDGEIVKGSKRLWPLTEFMKSSIVQAQAHIGEAERFEANAATGIQKLFEYYFCAENLLGDDSSKIKSADLNIDKYNGRYIDQLDQNSFVLANHSPASTLYHIVMAAIVAVSYMRQNQYEQ